MVNFHFSTYLEIVKFVILKYCAVIGCLLSSWSHYLGLKFIPFFRQIHKFVFEYSYLLHLLPRSQVQNKLSDFNYIWMVKNSLITYSDNFVFWTRNQIVRNIKALLVKFWVRYILWYLLGELNYLKSPYIVVCWMIFCVNYAARIYRYFSLCPSKLVIKYCCCSKLFLLNNSWLFST